MRRFALFVLALAAFAPLAAAQTSTWVPDKDHSSVDFSILHMSLSKVHGHFGKITGTVVWNETDVTKSNVNVTIDTTTIDTGVSGRDNDLKSPNFFDVTQYPTASFVSTNIARAGKNLTVSGNLTVHGITKPVVLQVEGPVGPVQGMGNKMHAGFSATTTLSRSAFNLGSKYPPAVVGDEVSLTIDLDLVKQ